MPSDVAENGSKTCECAREVMQDVSAEAARLTRSPRANVTEALRRDAVESILGAEVVPHVGHELIVRRVIERLDANHFGFEL